MGGQFDDARFGQREVGEHRGANSAGRVALGPEVWQDDTTGRFVPTHERAIGYVIQEAALFPHLDVRRNLAYGLKRIAPAERRIALDQVVDLLGIGHLLERHGLHCNVKLNPTLLGPARLPPPVVARLNAEIAAILRQPDVVEKIASQGGEIVAGPASEFAEFLPRDTAAWGKLIKEANIRLD